MPVIPATWESEKGRIVVKGQPREKLVRSHLNKEKLSLVVYTYHPGYLRCKGDNHGASWPWAKNTRLCLKDN
jgi:hypothetical protein